MTAETTTKDEAMKISDDKIKDTPRDANGERLDVGDVVYYGFSEFTITGYVDKNRDCTLEYGGGLGAGGGTLNPDAVEKTPTLTPTQYLPLARRTLDPTMTRRERLGMLAMGCIGEWGELRRAESPNDVVDDIGDLIWYASILQDEASEGQVRGYGFYRGPSDWIEMAKKEIYHGANEGFVRLMASYLLSKADEHASLLGLDLDEVRYRNIRKLLERYPDGFETGVGRDREAGAAAIDEKQEVIEPGDTVRHKRDPSIVGVVDRVSVFQKRRAIWLKWDGPSFGAPDLLVSEAVKVEPEPAEPTLTETQRQLLAKGHARQGDPDLKRLVDLGLVRVVHSANPHHERGVVVHFRKVGGGR